MNRVLLKQYTKLVQFLALVLGPDYEIALHDISEKANSIVAIANGNISGRTVGAPLTSMALKAIADKSYLEEDFKINYSGVTNGNKVLRSSTMYIKDDAGKLVGLLCINFDDSHFQELSTKLFQLCHPDAFVEQNIVVRGDLLESEKLHGEEQEQYPNSIAAITDSTIQEAVLEDGVPVDRLTQEEKLRIVKLLDEKGVFLLKGAVGYVAKELHSSSASIYRYLSRLRRQDAGDSSLETGQESNGNSRG